MRLVAGSRILNEADVIEPFIRHHAALFDLHVVLDNGSTDGTVEILRALHAEGLPIQLFQTASPLHLEQVYNTHLYQLALAGGADWVFFLDADELLVARAASVAEICSVVPESIHCLELLAYNYDRPAPPPGQHAFGAIRRRPATAEMPKIAVRRLDPARVAIASGNHFAIVDGATDRGFAQDKLLIAHVPDRSPLQLARKTLTKRLKSLATGEVPGNYFGIHRVPDYEALMRDPARWLAERAAIPESAVEDPVAYLGSQLRYTRADDDVSALISALATHADMFARAHGAIMDRKRLIKAELIRKGSQITRLL